MISSELFTMVMFIAALGACAWVCAEAMKRLEEAAANTIKEVREALEAEQVRVAQWWERDQRVIDNALDRLMSKEFETYAHASLVERPADQPISSADGALDDADSMARSLVERFLREDEPLPDVADDFANYGAPTIG